jgi:hypothetical protein
LQKDLYRHSHSRFQRPGVPTEAQLRDVELRDRIRSWIDEGRLPVLLPDRISAGYGSGSKCPACEQPITSGQIEYDVEYPSNGTPSLSLQQIECVNRTRKERKDSPSGHTSSA